MNKISSLFFAVLFCAFSGTTLMAQYQVNVPAETAFAEAEYAALGTRPTPVTVPHLGPQAVAGAMENSDYLSTGSTPFTFVIAHRGSHTAPECAENSACAIAAAYEAGADAIELDIKITNDDGPVLGHDVAIARELNNWIDSSGTPVTRSSAWTPFSEFPILDYAYLDLTKYPFLNNFRLNIPGGGCCVVDQHNPTRSTMNVNQIQNGLLVDTYNQRTGTQLTGNHQLTLYEALYLICKYYPMAIWLDVKSANDLPAVGDVIGVARQEMGATGPLGTISLKLGWSTVSNSTVNGNPGSAMNQSNITYFLVIGTGDLDAMAAYSGQPTSANAASLAYQSFVDLCTSGHGCLGAELSHKYPDAPTQAIYNDIKSADSYQLAGFQTVPQYSWYWHTLQSEKARSVTYGRTFPRTDGSCCFALTDSLNVSQYLGSEAEDLRALYSWNETEFSTITTDEPLTVLRDLATQGKRPISVAEQIGGTNISVPSGGNSTDIGAFRDGLYYIHSPDGYRLAVSGSGSGASLVLDTAGATTPRQMWYLSGKATGYYTITNVITGQSIFLDTNNGSPLLALGRSDNNSGYLWSISSPGSPGFTIRSSVTSVTNRWIRYQNTSVLLAASNNYPWALVKIVTPSSEKAQQQRGPAGYTYCADADLSPAKKCGFGPHHGSVAYGANGNFRYLPYTAGPIDCEQSSFNDIDPAPGVRKACFYAPYGNWSLPSNFTFVANEGGTFDNGNSQPSTFAYGAIDSTTGSALYTYITLPHRTGYSCDSSVFSGDPAPGIVKKCYAGPSPSSIPTGPTGFSYCAGEGEKCAFSGTAAVAFGASDGSTGKYTYKTFTNGVVCEPKSYGLDPDPNVVKSCFYMAATPLGTATGSALSSSFLLCASETGACTGLPQGSLVAFGATYQGQPSYDFITVVMGSVSCSIAAFGGVDPAPGVVKSCYYAPQSWVNRGPAGFTYCATGDVGATCQFNGVGQVAYGDDGYWTYIPARLNGIACNATAFGNDPHYGYYKACYYRLY